jgi:hypothetical protein
MSPVNTILFWVAVASTAAMIFFQLSHKATYQKLHGDIWGNIDGYTELRLDSDMYRVAYYCNDCDLASRFVLYRAAELTVDKGRDYFIVLDSNSNQSHWMQWASTEHVAFASVRMIKAPCSQPTATDAKAYLAANPAIGK